MSAWRGDRGSATAEFAIALPAAIIVLAIGAATLSACGHQVRLQDAVADAARLAGRGEGDRAAALVADAGGVASVSRSDQVVCVSATAPAGVPFVPFTLRARACALDDVEEGVDVGARAGARAGAGVGADEAIDSRADTTAGATAMTGEGG
ncbi:TadE family type IV pilus minor pilin [Microbacterium candidum]|uniref:TadE family type IV pilus minor pilin n=1 Tax=Microbacterium candidum TaxID=3041922 RepID=A0ABT7N2X4_9MICO|nr:TadE family type IV pilus minor pilin [Microbacterium sp. ASV49]MDL9981028.1 TadE family type IV pilus minor pilin [Microbacterium sp. ASV49]